MPSRLRFRTNRDVVASYPVQVSAPADPWGVLAAQPGFAETMRRALKQLDEAKAAGFGSEVSDRR